MAEIKAIIKGENQITSAVKAAEKDLTGFQNQAKKVGDALQSAFTVTAIIAGLAKLGQAAKQCIDEFSEAEKVSLRLEKVWNNVGNATGKSYASIEKYADAIEKTTYFSKSAVEESALLLAATESLSEDGFERALNLSADLAAALGEDMTAAASTLAKAMEDPSTALTRLKSIGVTFTEEEKNQIKALTEANQTYEAQELILNKIEGKYKDVAKAINDTPSGKLDNIKDVLSDIRKNLGGALLDVISPALELVYKALVKISEWVSKARASLAQEAEINDLTNRLNKGLGFDGLADETLYAAIDQYQRMIDKWNLRSNYSQGTYVGYIDQVEKELARRAEEAANALSLDKVEPIIISGVDESVQEIIDTTVSAFDKFFKNYGSSSKGYLAETYQAIIDEAQGFMDVIKKGAFAEEDGSIRAVSQLGLSDDTTIEDLRRMYAQLEEVVNTYTDKIANLNKVEEKKEEEDPISKAISQYGSLSKAFKIDELKGEINKLSLLRVAADDTTGHYLDQIIGTLFDQLEALEGIEKTEQKQTKTFVEQITDSFGKYLSKTFNLGDDVGSAAAGALIGTAANNLGEAGEVISRLATNMATMTPVIGAIVTALQYIIEGFAEAIKDTLNTFVQYGVGPLREFGRILADSLIPLFEAIMPSVEDSAYILVEIFTLLGKVLKPIITSIANIAGPILSKLTQFIERVLLPVIQAFANCIIGFVSVVEWCFQWLGHWIAQAINFLGGWLGIHVNDPGRPDDLATFIDNRLATVGEYNTDYAAESAQTAVQNASYTGGTTVHLNVYNYGNIVGENGINEFAITIRDKLYEMNYYGR